MLYAGACSNDFKKYLTVFYSSPDREDEPVGNALLWTSSSPFPASVDRKLEERAWEWVTGHPNISLRPGPEKEYLTLSDIELLEAGQSLNSPSQNAGETVVVQSGEVVAEPHERSTNHTSDKNTVPRLYATEERMWLALTGHGVDHQKLQPLEFELLSIIAGRREQGILQTDLTKVSGQDKRSLPRRTDSLFEKGYIDKRRVIIKGLRTSICIFRRYASNADAGEGSLELVKGDGTIPMDNLLEVVIRLVRDAKLISYEDLRRNMVCMLGMRRSFADIGSGHHRQKERI